MLLNLIHLHSLSLALIGSMMLCVRVLLPYRCTIGRIPLLHFPKFIFFLTNHVSFCTSVLLRLQLGVLLVIDVRSKEKFDAYVSLFLYLILLTSTPPSVVLSFSDFTLHAGNMCAQPSILIGEFFKPNTKARV